jgi:hypothetical protein
MSWAKIMIVLVKSLGILEKAQGKYRGNISNLRLWFSDSLKCLGDINKKMECWPIKW